jgi:hypothetical protein
LSEQDKATIIGRLTLESVALQKQEKFTEEELKLVVGDLERLLASLRLRSGHQGIMSRVPVSLGEYIQKYSDFTKLLDLNREYDSVSSQIQDIGMRLRSLGV